MAPYVEAVLAQGRSQPMLQVRAVLHSGLPGAEGMSAQLLLVYWPRPQVMARLLKVRHERGRNRTRERALVHMEQLVEALMAPVPSQPNPGGPPHASEAAAAGRMPYVYCVPVPLLLRLRKELAEQYMALGFVGGWQVQLRP